MGKIVFFSIAILIDFSAELLAQRGVATDSVVWQASKKYQNPSMFRQFFLGKNYRKEWATPVKLPVFSSKKQGLTVVELGGGQQTKSLRLKDRQGIEWVLRTIDKDVEKAMPEKLRNTTAQRITQDMISAAHPYAPVTIAPLSKAIGIVSPVPTIYFVPEDPGLEPYSTIFANSVCLLEQREPTPDRSETKSTSNLLEDLLEENDRFIIQQAVLKARLLDMLIADWDRHADQWRWGKVDSGRVNFYYAIPRDRDQAYFYSNGLLIKLARIVALPHLVGFRDDLSQLQQLNYKSWKFDDVFLNKLDRGQWETTIKMVQKNWSDDLIEKAVRQLPPEVYPISGPLIEEKLKKRRNDLLKQGMKYYRFLAHEVTINGTDEAEIFKVSGNQSHLIVQVFDKKDGKEGRKIYERKFIPSETHRISFFGFGGKDEFIVQEEAAAKIKLSISGGEGEDRYQINGSVKNKIYDSPTENNKMEGKSKSKIRMKASA